MEKKTKKNKKKRKAKDRAMSDSCFYVVDPCGCYSYIADPYGCLHYVNPCCC